MVKVSKVGVWKIGNDYFEDVKKATTLVRQQVVAELIEEQKVGDKLGTSQAVSPWVALNWDIIEARVKAAMAGA